MSADREVDWGHSCEGDRACTLHNLHCAYPNCEKGRRECVPARTERELALLLQLAKDLRKLLTLVRGEQYVMVEENLEALLAQLRGHINENSNA